MYIATPRSGLDDDLSLAGFWSLETNGCIQSAQPCLPLAKIEVGLSIYLFVCTNYAGQISPRIFENL